MSQRCSVVIALLLTSMILAGCEVGAPGQTVAPADTAAGEVAFDFVGTGDAALVIPVYLNDEGPFDFVLDTGATMTCVTPTLREQLGLPEATGRVGFGAGIGGGGRVQLVEADSLRVGEARAFDITLCVVSLEQLERGGLSIDGLLGLNFLREFHLSLDFDRRIATFR